MKIVLLTSTSLRHKYIANQLATKHNLELVVTELKSSKIEDTSGLPIEEEAFVEKHFKGRLRSEQKYFGTTNRFPENTKHIELKHGEINSKQIFEMLKEVNPNIIVLFGTSIIKAPIIDYFENRIINLHLGLSPYYRGSATNLFPLLDNAVEAIGATIHLATSKVDNGPILHQIRPDLLGDESLHDIGNKVILKAGNVLPDVLDAYERKIIKGERIKGRGKLCKISDLTTDVLYEIYDNIDTGLLLQFKKNKDQLFNSKPIVENI